MRRAQVRGAHVSMHRSCNVKIEPMLGDPSQVACSAAHVSMHRHCNMKVCSRRPSSSGLLSLWRRKIMHLLWQREGRYSLIFTTISAYPAPAVSRQSNNYRDGQASTKDQTNRVTSHHYPGDQVRLQSVGQHTQTRRQRSRRCPACSQTKAASTCGKLSTQPTGRR